MILSYIEGLTDFKNISGKGSNPAAGITANPEDNVPDHVDKNENSFEIKFQAYSQHIEKERFERELIAGSR